MGDGWGGFGGRGRLLEGGGGRREKRGEKIDALFHLALPLLDSSWFNVGFNIDSFSCALKARFIIARNRKTFSKVD